MESQRVYSLWFVAVLSASSHTRLKPKPWVSALQFYEINIFIDQIKSLSINYLAICNCDRQPNTDVEQNVHAMADEAYQITLAEPHEITDGDQRTITVSGYEDVGSMFMLELTDGGIRSIGKQLIEDVTPIE